MIPRSGDGVAKGPPGRWYRPGFRPRSLGASVAKKPLECAVCGSLEGVQARRVGTPRRQRTLALCPEHRAVIDKLLELPDPADSQARYRPVTMADLNRLKRSKRQQ